MFYKNRHTGQVFEMEPPRPGTNAREVFDLQLYVPEGRWDPKLSEYVPLTDEDLRELRDYPDDRRGVLVPVDEDEVEQIEVVIGRTKDRQPIIAKKWQLKEKPKARAK